VLVDGGVAKAPGDLAERIVAQCRKSLADFKVPREVRLVDELPRATLEKIAKNVLRAELAAEPKN
jgi:crotonobetaine/carnitine-CoA ligase